MPEPITDNDVSDSKQDISDVSKLQSTPDGVVPQELESATSSGASNVVPKHRPILKPHGRKNVKDSAGTNFVPTTLSSFLGIMITKRKLLVKILALHKKAQNYSAISVVLL